MESFLHNQLLNKKVLGLLLAVTSSQILYAGESSCGLFAEVAFKHAPIVRQDTDVTGTHSIKGAADYITAVDFDGEWDTSNNWKNIQVGGDRSAVCYYSVVETQTHWFVLYCFFHPRDWSDDPLTWLGDMSPFEHENDLEGLLEIVRRPASPSDPQHGTLEGMLTIFHVDFCSFNREDGRLKAGKVKLEGSFFWGTDGESRRPVVAMEAKGHGLKAAPYVDLDGDGIVYYPRPNVSPPPRNADDRNAGYRLVDIFEEGGLWSHRKDSKTFDSWGSFRGGGANAPWGWDDATSDVLRGEIATDPAKVAKVYFQIPESSPTYTINPYSTP